MNNIGDATVSASKPTASVNANPEIAYLNNSSFTFGLRAKAIDNDPKTIPTPAPAPVGPIVAKPAPIALAEFIKVRRPGFNIIFPQILYLDLFSSR